MLLENKTDEELMVLYQNGTERAFQLLYERHSSKVFGFICARIRNREKAHDLFQEVFVKIHKAKHLYNKSFPVLPWIFTITKNTIIDDARKVQQATSTENMDAFTAAEVLVVGPSLNQVAPLLNELPAAQRQAIELRYYEDRTFEEIAKTLKTSPLNVRQQVSRGIKQIKTLIGEGEKP